MLIEPKTAAEFSAMLAAEVAERDAAAKAAAASAGGSTIKPGQQGFGPLSGGGSSSPPSAGTGTATTPTPSAKKRMFYGTVELDPVKAKLQFSALAEEVILLFAQRPDVKVKISIEIEAESSSGFDHEQDHQSPGGITVRFIEALNGFKTKFGYRPTAFEAEDGTIAFRRDERRLMSRDFYLV